MLFCAILLAGCTPNKRLRVNDPAPSIAFQSAPQDWTGPAKSGGVWHNSKTASVAAIEFDEKGRLWPCNSKDQPNCQIDAALDFIKRARQEVTGKKVIVLTFVHGWHHNAGDSSYNFQNFETMINCLNWGNPTDDDVSQLNASEPVICSGMRPDKKHFYVGVYLGWRGESMRPYLGLLTNLSVLNRHDDAFRVANQAQEDGIERTILKLSKAAKQGADPAKFILLGHSFGGLIVNRVTADIYEKRMSGPHPVDETSCTDFGLPFTPFADLVVVINPADSSLHAAELVNRFKSHSKCPFPRAAEVIQRPMLISLHTSSDSVTDNIGSLALKVAPWVDRTYMNQIASDWANRPDSHQFLDDPPSIAELRRNTVNHVPYLRNFCYLDQPNRQDLVCLGLNDVLYKEKRDAFHSALRGEPDPVPFNTDYSSDPYFHGAYELLTSVCMTAIEAEMANSPWSKADQSKAHQFKADFKSPFKCEDNQDRREKRKALRDALVSGMRQYLAFPNEVGDLQDDLLLDLYRRFATNTLSCGDIQYDDSGKAKLNRQCDDGESVGRDPGQSPWNGTPVWMIDTSYEIQQAHSGLWNTDAFSIITGIADQFEVLPGTTDYDDLPVQLTQPPLHSSWPLAKKDIPERKAQRQQGQQQQQQQQK